MAVITINIPTVKNNEVNDFMSEQYGGESSSANTKALILDYVWGAVTATHVRRKGTDFAPLNPSDYGDLKPNRP